MRSLFAGRLAVIFALIGLATLTASAIDLANLDEPVEIKSSFQLEKALEIAPSAGALSASFNATSLNNMLQTFVPLIAYYALTNKTYEINQETKSILYKFKLDRVHLNSVSGFTEKVIEEIPGTDKLHIKLSGIQVDMLLDAELDALQFIPFKASVIQASDLSIDLIVQAPSSDKVHWKIIDTTKITVGNVKIDMKNKFLNWLVKQSDKIVQKVIQDQLPKFGAFIDSKVLEFDQIFEDKSRYNFDVPMKLYGKDLGLNLTMTTSPQIANDLIQINFDGIFDLPEASSVKKSFKPSKKAYPPRFEHAHSEQFYIHQDTVNSLLYMANDKIFPKTFNDKTVNEKILYALPEITKKYGSDVQILLDISLDESVTNPVSMNRKEGVALKSAAKASLMCIKNGKTESSEFTLDLSASMNMTMREFVAYPYINSVKVSNIVKGTDQIGLNEKEFTPLFNAIARDLFLDFNTEYSAGWPLTNLDPQLGMMGALLKNMTVSPYVTDEWMYAGFSMYADMPTAVPDLNIIQ